MEESILTLGNNKQDYAPECLIHSFLRTVIVDESKIETFEGHLQCEYYGAYMYYACSLLFVYILVLRVL